MRRLYIEIPDETFDALADQAAEQRRDPRDQAGWLLEQLLKPASDHQEPEREQVAA